MSEDSVLVDEPRRGIRVLTLNRPEHMNAWDAPMRRRMRDLVEDATVDPDLRCLVFAGAGKAFSAGEDVRGMAGLTKLGTRGFRAAARSIHNVFDTIEAMEIPVVAAIDGVAAGGGFELALSCDFRVLSTASRFVMPEVRVGLIPGSGGCSRLVRHVGLGKAKELVMLGRSINAEEATSLGLVTEVREEGHALDGALDLAERLAANAPLAVGMAKLVLNTCTEVDTETGRRLERLGQSVLKLSDDHREGAEAFMDKRRPQWRGA